MKHYNSGNVWGIVKKVEEKETTINKKKYLSILVNCTNELFGAVITYVTLWGEDNVNAFLDFYKDNKNCAYHFVGMLSQYEQEFKIGTNFKCFNWGVYEKTEFRASFILAGTVTAVDYETTKINVKIEREENGEKTFKVFELSVLEETNLQALSIGRTTNFKGLMRAKDPSDYYGGLSALVKPFVMEIKLGEKEDDLVAQTEVQQDAERPEDVPC